MNWSSGPKESRYGIHIFDTGCETNDAKSATTQIVTIARRFVIFDRFISPSRHRPKMCECLCWIAVRSFFGSAWQAYRDKYEDRDREQRVAEKVRLGWVQRPEVRRVSSLFLTVTCSSHPLAPPVMDR